VRASIRPDDGGDVHDCPRLSSDVFATARRGAPRHRGRRRAPASRHVLAAGCPTGRRPSDFPAAAWQWPVRA